MAKARWGTSANTAVSLAMTTLASSAYSLCTVAGPLTAAMIGISRSARRCRPRRPSVYRTSAAMGLVRSPRLGPSMSLMKLSPVPVRTSTRLSVSKAMSSSRRGKSWWVVPSKVCGPPPVWKRRVSTPPADLLSAKFWYRVK